ncbi:lipopolysaccharide biosynthesis protein [Enterovibrio norvegicus]|uniref:Wzz/FepE/Etk N-terminal domain-containing protein n=1 Tax=Enterovibrio norvegicus TaxID=188144 RepID=UPI0002FD7FD7|nr:Wzz/FepE/Etk N-terminal domain-containing protein [Enterovibrio norvegicus]OEF51350.1 lipopolysaccharide biosynthesis protein [Enterovibrio norvegicus]
MKTKIKKNISTILLLVIVVVPNVFFTFYQILIASPKYETRTQIVVKQPDDMATMDSSLAILSGLGVTSTNQDTELVKTYIQSRDMLNFLEKELELRKHFTNQSYDLFSRLNKEASVEEFHNYLLGKLKIEIDPKSSVISIYAQAFTPEYSRNLGENITQKSEWFINNISHELANAQLDFIKSEFQLAEERLEKTKSELIQFQRQNNLLDPKQDSMALSQIGYGLEGKIVEKKAGLKAIRSVMSDSSPLVMNTINEIRALSQQLEIEREKLVNENRTNNKASLNEVMNQFSDLKIKTEIALSAYKSATISLEKSRIEAYRKAKYLVIVEQPHLPESNRYPSVIYNILLLLSVSLIIFGMIRISIATIREIR